MNVPECWECGLPGTLFLDVLPVVAHSRGPGKFALCHLPPRDDRLPRITPQRVDRYPSPWRTAS